MTDRNELRRLAEACLAHLDNGPLWVEWEETGPGPVEFLDLLDEIDQLREESKQFLVIVGNVGRELGQTKHECDELRSEVGRQKEWAQQMAMADVTHYRDLAVLLKGALLVYHEADGTDADCLAGQVLADPDVEKLK